MANAFLTPTAVTREALRVLHQKLNFVGSITREYDDSFARQGAKIGDTLKVRLPNQYTVRNGSTLNLGATDTTESAVDLKVQTQKGVDLNFSSVDLTMNLDDFSDRVLEPAMSVLAANIEADAMSMYKDIYNQVQGAGAATFTRVLQGRKILVDNLAPLSGRTCNLNTQDNVDLVDALKGLFNDQTTIAKQNREGFMGRTAGFDFVENTLWPSHLRGAANAAYTTNTTVGSLPIVSTPVSTITVATGANPMNKGDVFTIANVFRVHPETKASTGIPQQFVVVSDPYAGGAGVVTIAPSIVLSGAAQNVIIPATAAAAGLTFSGTAGAANGISMAYQKGAFAFASADMVMPRGVDFAAREVFDGVSMRIVRQYDINNDKFPCRLDVLYGYKTIRPQLACRLANN